MLAKPYHPVPFPEQALRLTEVDFLLAAMPVRAVVLDQEQLLARQLHDDIDVPAPLTLPLPGGDSFPAGGMAEPPLSGSIVLELHARLSALTTHRATPSVSARRKIDREVVRWLRAAHTDRGEACRGRAHVPCRSVV